MHYSKTVATLSLLVLASIMSCSAESVPVVLIPEYTGIVDSIDIAVFFRDGEGTLVGHQMISLQPRSTAHISISTTAVSMRYEKRRTVGSTAETVLFGELFWFEVEELIDSNGHISLYVNDPVTVVSPINGSEFDDIEDVTLEWEREPYAQWYMVTIKKAGGNGPFLTALLPEERTEVRIDRLLEISSPEARISSSSIAGGEPIVRFDRWPGSEPVTMTVIAYRYLTSSKRLVPITRQYETRTIEFSVVQE